MSRKIVLGVDGSAGSAAAVRWCAEYAPALGAEVIAVHGISFDVYPSSVAMGSSMDEQWRKELLHDVETEWCKPLQDAGVPFRAKVGQEVPAQAIMRIADSEGADLIVVGKRGRGGFTELLLGSVSHQLTHHARHPIVVVPPSKE